VTVGARAFVGAGAAVKPGIAIGADAVVALGAAVVRDVAPGAVVAGTPARPLERGEGAP
jgi:acetyltransferase-like isoleucine patch superfamily enzyme